MLTNYQTEIISKNLDNLSILIDNYINSQVGKNKIKNLELECYKLSERIKEISVSFSQKQIEDIFYLLDELSEKIKKLKDNISMTKIKDSQIKDSKDLINNFDKIFSKIFRKMKKELQTEKNRLF